MTRGKGLHKCFYTQAANNAETVAQTEAETETAGEAQVPVSVSVTGFRVRFLLCIALRLFWGLLAASWPMLDGRKSAIGS